MRAALTFLLIVLLLLPAAGEAGAHPSAFSLRAEGPLSLEEYWQQVETTRQAVADLEHQPAAMRLSRLGQLADGWEQITGVSMPDGTLLPLQHSELAALLRRTPPDLPGLLGRLDALLALHDHFPSSLFSLHDVDSLKTILTDPRFQWGEARPSAVQQWWDDFLKKLGEWLDRLFGGADGRSVTIPVGPILTWGLVVLLVVVLAFAGRGLLADLVRDVELAGHEPGEHELLTSAGAFQRADSLSRGGDYRSAVRYLYLSALLLLDERGLLRYDRSRTNREYLRSVSDSPALTQPLRSVIEIFDRVWYGFEPIDARTYQEYVERVGELRKQKP